MAAPEHLPTPRSETQHYSSPPQRSAEWSADRPGESIGQAATNVATLGSPGPDQGYALTLTSLFDDRLSLAGEHRADVDAGSLAVALKRASLFGRAPVVHDLRIGYTLFGFLDETASLDLVEFRKDLFAEVHYPFHYFGLRTIADLIAEEVLLQTPDQVATRYRAGWRDQLNQ